MYNSLDISFNCWH